MLSLSQDVRPPPFNIAHWTGCCGWWLVSGWLLLVVVGWVLGGVLGLVGGLWLGDGGLVGGLWVVFVVGG